MDELAGSGLGPDYDVFRLDRTTEAWITAGMSLRAEVADLLSGEAEAGEQIGSASVVDLVAKPIVDLAVGLATGRDVGAVRGTLEGAVWIYRGDAGDDGGHVFVLEVRPWYRVAHIHVVPHDGPQWRNNLRLRDRRRPIVDYRAPRASSDGAPMMAGPVRRPGG